MRTPSIALIVCLLTGTAAAEPLGWSSKPYGQWNLPNGGVLELPSSKRLDLAPRWKLVPPEGWDLLDAEMHRLQTENIRITAENKSLKISAGKGGGSVWWAVGGFLAGAAAGWAYMEYGR